MSYLQFAENIRKATVKRYVFTINNVLAALGSKLALYRCRSSDTQFPQWHSCYFGLRPDLKVISGTKLANIEKMSNFIKHCYMGSCDFLDFGDFDQYILVNPILTVII